MKLQNIPMITEVLLFTIPCFIIQMRPTAGGPGAPLKIVGPKLSANGPLPAKLGRASARPNLAEWSERMRAERSPMSTQILGFQYIVRRARAGCYAEFGQVAVKRCVAREISDGNETRPREDLAQTSRPAFSTLRAIIPFAPNPLDPMRAPHPIICIYSECPGQISRNGPQYARFGRA
jgi:hypothetical protein